MLFISLSAIVPQVAGQQQIDDMADDCSAPYNLANNPGEAGIPAGPTDWIAMSPNPEFIEYREQLLAGNLTSGNRTHGLGYTPAPVKLSNAKNTNKILSSLRQMSSYPSSYDLRTLDRVTSVKDQGIAGTCWAFATFSSLESCLMPAEIRNFSENNLKNTAGFDTDPNDGGGNIDMATAYLTRWSGPVDETDDPYNPDTVISPSRLDVQKHVQDVLYLPEYNGPSDSGYIKSALMSYGAVWAYMEWGIGYYNSTHHSYYYNTGSTEGGHAVAIVGWDDNYDRNKFNSLPPGNGAFIVKNSWGAGWGENGYFYVSYYDSIFADSCAVFIPESTDNYDNIYQYDPLGWTLNIGAYNDVLWFANVFTARSDEMLEAVGFYVPEEGDIFDIYVFNETGLIASRIGIENTPMGYHTFPLDTPVSLKSGEEFSVEVKVNPPGSLYSYICAEMPFSGYSSRATANASESYVSLDGAQWYDVTVQFPDTDVCLKAYTVNSVLPGPPTIGFYVASQTVDENAGNVTITLQKNGYAAANASVSYSTGSGNATAGTHYLAATGTVVFQPAETTKTFTVPILDDGVYGGQKMFYVNLSDPVNAVFDADSLPVYVNNVDGLPVIYFDVTSMSVYDDAGDINVKVTKAGSTEFSASVNYYTFNGTAEAGRDFMNASGTLTFAPDEKCKNITITILADAEYEDDDTFGVFLGDPDNATLNSSMNVVVGISTSFPHTHISLVEGWNLISIPIVLENNSLNGIFSESVLNNITDIWGWNESEQNWVYYSCDPGDSFYQYFPRLTGLETGRAYWVRMIGLASITTVEGTVPDCVPNSPVALVPGWNFIGMTGMSPASLASMYPEATDVWGWDESVQNWIYFSCDPDDYFYQYFPKLYNILPGDGYWVRMV